MSKSTVLCTKSTVYVLTEYSCLCPKVQFMSHSKFMSHSTVYVPRVQFMSNSTVYVPRIQVYVLRIQFMSQEYS